MAENNSAEKNVMYTMYSMYSTKILFHFPPVQYNMKEKKNVSSSEPQSMALCMQHLFIVGATIMLRHIEQCHIGLAAELIP